MGMNLVKAMATVGGLTGISRIAGFIRDILTASILGAGPVADAFFVALKLPNFFRRVTAEGAFSVSFVPVYSESLETEGRKTADDFALNIFHLMFFWLGGFTLLALWAMPWIIYGIAPGFRGDELRFDLAIDLARITFPYLLLMSLTALLGGVLNALDKFAPFAIAPVLFNLSLIGALIFNKLFETAGHAMAWGVFVAGILQFLYLFFSVRKAGLKYHFKRPTLTLKTRKVLRLMGPGVIGAGVVHINLFADLIIASFLPAGAISYLYYADRLNQLPLGVVGIAVGTALLPMLSKALSRGDTQESQKLFSRALEACLMLALPAAAAMVIIPDILISALFERGAFDAVDSAQTARVLMCYALGLPAYVAVKVFSTAHWSRQDTKTPVKISIVATLMNIGLSLAFIQFIGVAGIALATGLTGWVQFFAHIQSLRDHPAVGYTSAFKRNITKICLSVALMAGALFGTKTLLRSAFDFHVIIDLIILVVMGMVSYFTLLFMSGVLNRQTLQKWF
jgi:putative peptidoglycan lipid II flippase